MGNVLRFFTFVLGSGFVLATIGLIVGITLFTLYAQDAPPLDLSKLDNPEPSVIYDAHGEVVTEIGSEPRIEVSIEQMPQELLKALIAVEDSRFFYHQGIDPIRITRAALTSLSGSHGSEGGSTLTQQLVKVSFLDPNDMSLERKAQEATMAWNLENIYSKSDILSAYINKVYMGNGVYGMETAAQYYYGKSLTELGTHQLALLAGIPQAPSANNPHANPELAKERRNTVLYRMERIGVIDTNKLNELSNIDIMDGIVPQEQAASIYKNVEKDLQEYIDQVIRQVRDDIGIDLFNSSVHIYTALQPEKQKAVNSVIYTDNYFNFSGSKLEPTVAVTNIKNGEVVAIAGGNANTKELGVPGGFSYPVDGRLQPASTIKPIIDYAPALQLLGYTMNHKAVDEPITYSTGTPVHNYDGQYKGKMTLEDALTDSRNTVAMKLFYAVGPGNAYQFANALGLNVPEHEWFESGSIGAINIPMVDLANAFGTLANNGVKNELTYVRKITDRSNITLWETEEPKQIMDPVKAYDLVSSMRRTVWGTDGFAHKAQVQGYDIAGKTGTNNYTPEEGMPSGYAPSVSFAGITPDVSIVVYLEGETRTRGLHWNSGEQQMPQDIYRVILPLVSNDYSKFEKP